MLLFTAHLNILQALGLRKKNTVICPQKLLLHIFAMVIHQRMAPSTQQLKDQDDVLTLKIKQGFGIFC